MPNSYLPKILPSEIKYLAFGGGGGKGVTFLGAIQTLENEKVLPIKSFPAKNQIKGISGSSAGGIIALFLAMGYNAKDLEGLISGNQFLSFWDSEPKSTCRKAIVDNNSVKFIRDRSATAKIIDALAKSEGFLKILEAVLTPKYEYSDPDVQRILSKPIEFFYNFICDGGFFPGYGVTRFFQQKLEKWVDERYGKLPYGEITFAKFEWITGVKLVITGTNISKQKPFYFSTDYTPDFPVGEAVAISMNMPLLFKPIYVDSDVKVDEPLLRELYRGLWVDGGLSNNYPIHAFDFEGHGEFYPIPGEPLPEEREFNPNILGFRLVESNDQKEHLDVFPSFRVFIRQLCDSLLYPSGQIQTYSEENRTICLETYGISTSDFAPSKKKKDKAIAEARKKVSEYFNAARQETNKSPT